MLGEQAADNLQERKSSWWPRDDTQKLEILGGRGGGGSATQPHRNYLGALDKLVKIEQRTAGVEEAKEGC